VHSRCSADPDSVGCERIQSQRTQNRRESDLSRLLSNISTTIKPTGTMNSSLRRSFMRNWFAIEVTYQISNQTDTTVIRLSLHAGHPAVSDAGSIYEDFEAILTVLR
jgi:hypothetical protein